jgi:hypothetical protein
MLRIVSATIQKLSLMNWYDTFNAIEAALWAIVAIVIPLKATPTCGRQRFAIALASITFIAFGVSDLFEIGKDGNLPMWLWGYKVSCGIFIFSARFTWRGWSSFRLSDREVLFGLFCLIAVSVLILLQWKLNSIG